METNDSQVLLQTDLLNSRFSYAIVENLKKPFELTSREQIKFVNVIDPFAKTIENRLFSKTVVLK